MLKPNPQASVITDLKNKKLPKGFAMAYYAIWFFIGLCLFSGGIYFMLHPGSGEMRGNIIVYAWLSTAFGFLRIVNSGFQLWKMSRK